MFRSGYGQGYAAHATELRAEPNHGDLCPCTGRDRMAGMDSGERGRQSHGYVLGVVRRRCLRGQFGLVHLVLREALANADTAGRRCCITRRWSGPRRRYTVLAVERRGCAAAATQRHYVIQQADTLPAWCIEMHPTNAIVTQS